MKAEKADKNRLSGETSPYLLQHAANLVDWHPWGKDALEKAEKEDKPILLSVGYSACHWCHVMAHESFEDTAIAGLMNELFVNVKVDREERPDLDKIYQSAHQLLTGRAGGWPLTMFLTPGTLVPFFGGTYFPPEPRHDLPSFSDILRSVDEIYRQRREEVEAQNVKLVEFLKQAEQPGKGSGGVVLDVSPLKKARSDLSGAFDDVNGGFGGAPKFPMPSSLERLLRDWAASFHGKKADGGALEMVRFALESMAQGGIYDQLGGGFFRYSVDDRWEIPHFEKMLYDNGLLLSLYADAWLATGEPLFRRVAEDTAGWVMREMQAPEGGYLSSLDADSGGEEGGFYAWGSGEVEKILDGDEYRLFACHFGLDQPVNFEEKWHLHVNATAEDLAEQLSMTEDEFAAAINSSRQKLLDAREKRARPGVDDKVLSSWNGLMLKGMARAGRLLGRKDFVESAERSLGFVRGHMFEDGRLLATHSGGRARHAGYLDDYAFMLEGVIELLQARWKAEDMEFAVSLADALLEHFQDDAAGGFFFTAHDHEKLIFRPKPVADDALPSGNGVAANALARLGHLLGETLYTDAAELAVKAAWASIENAPSSYTTLLTALDEILHLPQTVIIRGDGDELEKWQRRCSSRYAPGRVAIAIPSDAGGVMGLLAERKPAERTVAYVCSGIECNAPVTSFSDFEKELESVETQSVEPPKHNG